jgi:ketosteroid isomerase-like protein
MTTVGEQWVTAIAARDSAGLAALLTDDIDFRGLTPRKAWEATTPAEVVDVVLGTWFDDGTSIDEVEEVTTDEVADTHRVGYRFRTTTAEGPHLIEQQAYFRNDGARIGYLRIVCSGYRPLAT